MLQALVANRSAKGTKVSVRLWATQSTYRSAGVSNSSNTSGISGGIGPSSQSIGTGDQKGNCNNGNHLILLGFGPGSACHRFTKASMSQNYPLSCRNEEYSRQISTRSSKLNEDWKTPENPKTENPKLRLSRFVSSLASHHFPSKPCRFRALLLLPVIEPVGF